MLGDYGAEGQGSLTAVAVVPPTAAGPTVVAGPMLLSHNPRGSAGYSPIPTVPNASLKPASITGSIYSATGLRITPPYCYLLRRGFNKIWTVPLVTHWFPQRQVFAVGTSPSKGLFKINTPPQ